MAERIVITGLGLLTPLGCGVEASLSRLIAGKSGARRIEEFEVDDLYCQIGCFVPRGSLAEGKFNADDWMEPKEQRKVDDFIIYSMAAATQALEDAGWKADTKEKQERTGVLIGSGIGGLSGIADTSLLLKEKGPRRVSPFFIPGRLINLASGYVSIRHDLKGPNHAVVTACSTGAHAIGDAARLIALDDADVMVAGGAESPICRIAVAGFAACRALSTNFNDQPQKASRPYDRYRDGFVMGEGAGVVVLESLEHAKARGARVYAEVIGYGLSGDAYHITAPGRRWRLSLHEGAEARWPQPSDIDYIMRTAPTMNQRGQARHVVDQVGYRTSAGGGRRRGGDLLHPRHAGQYRSADPESRQPVGRDCYRPGAAQGEKTRDRLRAVELVRLRRHQCQPRPAPCRLTTPDAPRPARLRPNPAFATFCTRVARESLPVQWRAGSNGHEVAHRSGV
jgi:3-oxoacyl-[acyl-carrier-protein] synthase II